MGSKDVQVSPQRAKKRSKMHFKSLRKCIHFLTGFWLRFGAALGPFWGLLGGQQPDGHWPQPPFCCEMAPRWRQDGPGCPQDVPKWRQDGLRCPRMASKSPQDGPKMAQDAPRRPHDRPKMAQDDTRCPQDRPKWPNTKKQKKKNIKHTAINNIGPAESEKRLNKLLLGAA